MEGERHLLSNHADIEATINNAIEHFLYEESFREEQKICFNLVGLRPGRFRDSSNGLWETFIFLLFPRVINVITGNVGESISTIIIVAPLVAIMKPKTQAIWNNSNNSHRLGTGGRHGRRHGNVKGRCACEIIYGSPERQKKILFEGLFSRNKQINALIEVKENQYLTASGIKFFQKQTSGNNCPVCMTDRLNVRPRATEIRFA